MSLYTANHPERFWRPLLERMPEVWNAAIGVASESLPAPARAQTLEAILEATLGEGQFGPDHWRLSIPRRLYYRLKPWLPRRLMVGVRRRVQERARHGFLLDWPIEDRYRRFLWSTMNQVLAELGRQELPFIFFWPHGTHTALVLTHDVEDRDGQRFVGEVADREEELNFRSAFNFVAERYPLDRGLISDLLARGFEVGIHGLRHDGRELTSQARFEAISARLNRHLAELGAVGFRSPLTHRHPAWMQALDVEYDSSFFDTDPFEPMPGGTMSLWPFTMGRFIQLPYTLTQDFTLTEVLGHREARLWLEKAGYLQRWHGMALVNTHPDYLRQPGRWDVYADFLGEIRSQEGWWNPLPREAARWWRRRSEAAGVEDLEGGHQGMLRLGSDGEIEVIPPPGDIRQQAS